MKVEMYNIQANKSFLGENGPDFHSENFKVRAIGHIQHNPNSTELQGLSTSGLKKINYLREKGFMVLVEVGGRNIGIENT